MTGYAPVSITMLTSEPEQVTVVADGGADVEALLAGLPRCGQVLAAVLDPFHRSAQRARGGRDREFLPGGANLQSERAADVTSQDAHPVGGDTQARGHPHPGDVHALRGRVHGQQA